VAVSQLMNREVHREIKILSIEFSVIGVVNKGCSMGEKRRQRDGQGQGIAILPSVARKRGATAKEWFNVWQKLGAGFAEFNQMMGFTEDCHNLHCNLLIILVGAE
jgi:hypothetical protein